jgi:putative Mn2+ efflux pump MntP
MNIILLGLLTGIDNFIVSAGFGTLRLGRTQQLLVVAAFAICEAFMPLLGYHLAAAATVGPIEWLGPVLLIAAGALIASRVYRGTMPEAGPGSRPLHLLFLAPVMLSLDNLAAGAALNAFGGFNYAAALNAGVIAAMLSIMGLWIGSRALQRPAFRSQLALACCLIAVGAFGLARGI